MSYHHLSIEERACIVVYYKEKRSVTEIAKLLGRSKSAISRELQQNESRDKGYNAIGAQRKYKQRRWLCVRKTKMIEDKQLYRMVCEGLEKYWSPEQICHTLPKNHSISYCTIYRAIANKILPKGSKRKTQTIRQAAKTQKSKGYLL